MNVSWVQAWVVVKTNQLTARKVASARTPGYYGDGGGLYLQVTKGAELNRSWVYRFSSPVLKNASGRGRVREMGLGSFETFSLAEARQRARECRQQVAEGLDPIEARKASRAKNEARAAKRITFADATERYIKAHERGWRNPKHRQQWRSTLETYAFPVIGRLFVEEIELAHVLRVLQPIWSTKTETASRLRGRVERILSWATVGGFRKGDNPARWRGNLSEMLPAKQRTARAKRQPSLPYTQIAEFMSWLRAREGVPAKALEFLILTAVRDNEVRGAVWSEFDLDEKVWTIAPERMKAGNEHRVPLCDRAIEILESVPRVKGNPHVFAGQSRTGMLSENTLNKIAQQSGLIDPKCDDRLITAHGFRATFRTWGDEHTSYPKDVLEASLAHTIRDQTERAYRRGSFFQKRQRLMDKWGRFCEQTATGEVIPLRGAV